MRVFAASAIGVVLAMSAGAAGANEGGVRAAIAKIVPGARISSIRAVGDGGLYEATVQGQIVYVSADGKHLLTGELWDVDARRNLTEQRKNGLRRDLLAEVRVEDRIVFPAVAPKHRVTVFTDFDCGYCRKLHADVQRYNEAGITFEYLLLPRAGQGSPSYEKAISVWCAVDRKSAFTLAKQGGEPSAAKCPHPIDANVALVERMGGIIGTPMLVRDDGAVTGYQSPEQLLAWLEHGP